MERLVHIAGGLGAPAAARDIVSDISGIAPTLPRTLVEDVRLLVSEIVTNSVRHGGGNATPVEIRLALTDRTIRVEVTDSGPGFQAPAQPSPHTDRPGGWGLLLVDRIANRWGVDPSESTTVWFEIDVDDPAFPRQISRSLRASA